MIEDRQLTEHFSLYALTKTNNLALQEINRQLTEEQITKLTEVAKLWEQIRTILGCAIVINSGFRSPMLNKATVGSSLTSQHPKCEAADGTPEGMTVQEAFVKLRAAAKLKQFIFGQLIYEKANRDYGTVEWIHCSLGSPYREYARCGEILTMQGGNYQLIETV